MKRYMTGAELLDEIAALPPEMFSGLDYLTEELEAARNGILRAEDESDESLCQRHLEREGARS